MFHWMDSDKWRRQDFPWQVGIHCMDQMWREPCRWIDNRNCLSLQQKLFLYRFLFLHCQPELNCSIVRWPLHCTESGTNVEDNCWIRANNESFPRVTEGAGKNCYWSWRASQTSVLTYTVIDSICTCSDFRIEGSIAYTCSAICTAWRTSSGECDRSAIDTCTCKSRQCKQLAVHSLQFIDCAELVASISICESIWNLYRSCTCNRWIELSSTNTWTAVSSADW